MRHGRDDGVRWGDLLVATTRTIGDRTHARWVCEVASGADRIDDVLDEPATDRMVAQLDSMLTRHAAGEPLAYVLGRWGFRHLDLAVDGRVLIPRPETELTAGIAIELANWMPRPLSVVDLGTGSGAIGLALATELPLRGVEVWLTDISEDALDVARANLAGVGGAMANAHVVCGEWFAALPDDLVVDVAVANPPYVAEGSPDLDDTVRRWEPAIALYGGDDGLGHLRTLIDDGPNWVRAGGWLVLEIAHDQGAVVADSLRARGFEHVEVRQDLTGRDRVAIGRSPGAG